MQADPGRRRHTWPGFPCSPRATRTQHQLVRLKTQKSVRLFANVRPCRSRPELTVLRKPIDLIIVRENTERFPQRPKHVLQAPGIHARPDMALSVRKITARASTGSLAPPLGSPRAPPKVTAVHKANVVKLSDGLFLREVRKVAQRVSRCGTPKS